MWQASNLEVVQQACRAYISAKVGGTSKLSVKSWPIVFVSKTLTAKNFSPKLDSHGSH